MVLPILNGIIDRRLLINYRVKPEVVKFLLPSHLEPLVINGYASGGICLLRLKNIGIKNTPSVLRITSENAAHRFLVRFKEDGRNVNGVYIPRRDTDSMLNVVLAGQIFSWPHYRADFAVDEGNGKYSVKMKSRDNNSSLHVETQLAQAFPSDSMFGSLMHASDQFKSCSIGVSPSLNKNKLKTIELKTKRWEVKPLEILKLKSSYFEDRALFPEGSIQFDNALLMKGIEHEWLSHS